MSGKTFPLRVSDEWLKKVREAKNITNSPSIHQFLIDAIDEKVGRVTKKEEQK